MKSPLATRQRADAAHQANAITSYALPIITAMAICLLLIMAIGHGFAKMDRYDRTNQEWNLR